MMPDEWFQVSNAADIPSPALLVYVERAQENIRRLMGRKPELRLAYIQENAKFVRDLDV